MGRVVGPDEFISRYYTQFDLHKDMTEEEKQVIDSGDEYDSDGEGEEGEFRQEDDEGEAGGEAEESHQEDDEDGPLNDEGDDAMDPEASNTNELDGALKTAVELAGGTWQAGKINTRIVLQASSDSAMAKLKLLLSTAAAIAKLEVVSKLAHKEAVGAINSAWAAQHVTTWSVQKGSTYWPILVSFRFVKSKDKLSHIKSIARVTSIIKAAEGKPEWVEWAGKGKCLAVLKAISHYTKCLRDHSACFDSLDNWHAALGTIMDELTEPFGKNAATSMGQLLRKLGGQISALSSRASEH